MGAKFFLLFSHLCLEVCDLVEAGGFLLGWLPCAWWTTSSTYLSPCWQILRLLCSGWAQCQCSGPHLIASWKSLPGHGVTVRELEWLADPSRVNPFPAPGRSLDVAV